MLPRVLPDLVPASRLRSADALAVADRLFAAEATWHQGNNLAQTVFTCLYLLQPDRCNSCAPSHDCHTLPREQPYFLFLRCAILESL